MSQFELTCENVLLWLSLSEISSLKQAGLFELYPDIVSIWERFESDKLQLSQFLSPASYEKLKENKNAELISAHLGLLKRNDIGIVTIFDSKYSPLLNQNEVDPPKLLYYKGDISLLLTTNLAVVGSRTPTSYGKNNCRDFVCELSNAGLTIVSGLATGIDAIAHEAALDSKGSTIAVLGNGLNKITPVYNLNLAAEIAKKGLLLSEFPFNKQGAKYTFPQRNRIISGLSLGVFIVEAAQSSGTLITANFAIEQNREVFALCGDINRAYSKGTNNLIKEHKAHLVTSASDILEHLGIEKNKKTQKTSSIALDFFAEKIYNLISVRAIHFDELVEQTDISVVQLNRILIELELKGLIKKLPQNYYSL